ncbi:LLM class flavin-dependent oxidoreductase [Nakamurella leprariae]|uniref:LLM class flavin-dependent oxidoreductase n=1 Tax=Nakamurella leprariae TaxID=2803911 RepID=A0A938YI90_9ACTN|nr:LLM class flavin-dependent oxidoreductase [Nakamurella leprariae]MBM9468817.1 LLM class flavin-dependent oxidoreductase [Nakamurella leprariae]
MGELRIGLTMGGAGDLRGQLALAAEAERRGFDLITAGDSSSDVFTMLGALAHGTARIGLVANIAGWTRTPATTAHAATTISNLSGGRFTLGLGPTPKAWVEGWHGMAFDPVVPRMREYVTAVRACLAATPDAPTAVDGRYYPTHGYTNWGVDAPPVPVALGVTLPRMTELAGEVCDGAMLNSIVPFETIGSAVRDRLDQGRARAGRTGEPFDVGILRFVGVHDDRATAYDLCRAQIAFYFPIPYFTTVLQGLGFEAELAAGTAAAATGDRAAAVAAVSDRLVDALGIAGTPGEARERLQAYAGLVDWVALAGTLDLPHDQANAHLGRILDTFGTGR